MLTTLCAPHLPCHRCWLLLLCRNSTALKRQLLSRKLVKPSNLYSGVHCLAPACIRASVTSSLAKLRLQTLDLLYLHNAAEVQLQPRGKQGFMDTLRLAFKVGEEGEGRAGLLQASAQQ